MRAVALAVLVVTGCGREPETPAPSARASSKPAPPREDARREAGTEYTAAVELERAGKPAEALEAVRRSLASAPTRDAYMLGARLAITLGDDAQAERWTDAVIAEHPEDALAFYNRGLIAQRADRYNAARTAYIAALRLQPNLADARYNLALLVWSQGAKDEARHHVTRFLEMFPEDTRGPALRQMMTK